MHTYITSNTATDLTESNLRLSCLEFDKLITTDDIINNTHSPIYFVPKIHLYFQLYINLAIYSYYIIFLIHYLVFCTILSLQEVLLGSIIGNLMLNQTLIIHFLTSTTEW